MTDSARSLDTGSGTLETHEIRIRMRSTRTWAVEIQDDGEPRRILLGHAPVIVGTSRSCGAVVRDPTVSARHCELSTTALGVSVRDLGSRNGTYVGGARVQDALAAEGTSITVGKTTLVCVTIDDEEVEEEAAPLPGLAGSSRAMRRVAAQVRRLAKLSAPVLVAGETGVGKELVARALHTEGPRSAEAFIAMNVASLPRELVESELFGHERGAFTGAVARRAGAFADAAGGTLFLDEIGELPLDAQPKLLRALDGYEVRRVGGAGSGQRANARVVVATHVPLEESVAKGAFRRDLFHRLEVFVIDVPPLRERPGDIAPIVRRLLVQMEHEIGRRDLTPAALAKLTAHDWPGNVRELRNVLLRAADMAGPAKWLDADSVERGLRKRGGPSTAPLLCADTAREHLVRYDGNISAAARAAGVPRTTFRKALKPGPRKT